MASKNTLIIHAQHIFGALLQDADTLMQEGSDIEFKAGEKDYQHSNATNSHFEVGGEECQWAAHLQPNIVSV